MGVIRGVVAIGDHVHVYHYNAFSTHPDKGNPAGVVFETSGLTQAKMLYVAKQAG